MYKFRTTKRFDKALKLCQKRGYPIEKLQEAITLFWSRMGICLLSTNLICCMEIMRAIGRRI